MSNVPLANINEWSTFDLNKVNNENNEIEKSTKSKLKNESNNLSSETSNDEIKLNESIKKEIHKSKNETINESSKSIKRLFKNESTKSNEESNGNEKSMKLNLNNQTDDEIEEEFSAFEQFEQSTENQETKLKVESLEELVNTFDEKIVNCFINYEEPVESISEPVQIMNHDELISQCQMWFKLTENFNILPINWQRTHAMKFLLPYLLGDKKVDSSSTSSNRLVFDKNVSMNSNFDINYLDCKFDANLDRNYLDESFDTKSLDYQFDDDQFVLSSYGYDYSTCRLHTNDYSFDRGFDESLNKTLNSTTRTNHYSSYLNEFESEYEEQLHKDLDFHSLIIYSNTTGLPFTAEEVLKELDFILAEDDNYLESTLDHSTLDNSVYNYPNSNHDLNETNETDELDDELAKETLLNNVISTSFYNNSKFIKSNLLKPFNAGHTNSMGTSFSSNSLDDVLSSGYSGYSLSRSKTSSSQISSGVDVGYSSSCAPANIVSCAIKSQSEIENEKQLFEEKLRTLNITQLNEIYLDLEKMIQNHSEILISELALKDELEYEKELKNQFITLLISIQNKRRKQILNQKAPNSKLNPSSTSSKYLTTIISYNSALGPPDTRTLQILIKILKAINDDSPTVATLLTDFILKVLCPTT